MTLKEQYLDFINLLNYPVLITNDINIPVLANKKFLNIHKITLSTIEKLKDIIINHNPMQEQKYILKQTDKETTFKVLSSEVLFNNEKFYLVSLFNISKENKVYEDTLFAKKTFQQVSEYLPEGIILFEHNILYSNSAFEKLSGYRSKELLVKKFSDLLESSNRETFDLNINKLFLQKKSYIEQELQLINKKNKIIWIRVKISLVKNTDKTFFLSVVTNISQEKSKYEQLSNIAYFDALTGIYNRRKFNELLLTEYKRSKRYKRDLSGLFFDIDHFKKINDLYGHDVGDIVLQELSNLVQHHVRETDFFARWGGEEFIILLPETNLAKALSLAEYIRVNIFENKFSTVEKVTVSFGITQLKGQEQQKTFLKRLDNALYKAKQNGRNCVISL